MILNILLKFLNSTWRKTESKPQYKNYYDWFLDSYTPPEEEYEIDIYGTPIGTVKPSHQLSFITITL